MKHLHWIAREIDANRNLIEPAEFFYEGGTHKRLSSLDAACVTMRGRLRSMRQALVTLGIPRVGRVKVHCGGRTLVGRILGEARSNRETIAPESVISGITKKIFQKFLRRSLHYSL